MEKITVTIISVKKITQRNECQNFNVSGVFRQTETMEDMQAIFIKDSIRHIFEKKYAIKWKEKSIKLFLCSLKWIPVFLAFGMEVSNASISARTATDSLATFVRIEPLPIGILPSDVGPFEDLRRVSIADEMAAALPAKTGMQTLKQNAKKISQFQRKIA